METELFGPVMTIFVYEDAKTLELLDASPYALTGAVFSQDRYAIEVATVKLQMLPVTSISMTNQQVLSGQQPFGGARASGTNDKAGSPLNLLRWASPRTIKETFVTQ
jgi:1-pyrroline-5-carboxylate dehydrogenase